MNDNHIADLLEGDFELLDADENGRMGFFFHLGDFPDGVVVFECACFLVHQRFNRNRGHTKRV